MTGTLSQTPLHDWHAAHGGRMVDFAGWSMPVQYTSIVAEHNATRTSAGLFDISHMGRLRFDGPAGLKFLDSVVTRRVDDLKPGRVRYGLVCNDAGGILDDVLVYHLSDAGGGSYAMLVVNASNREKILDWLKPRLGKYDTTLTDCTHDWAMIAVQGPHAIELAQPLVGVPIAPMKYYTAQECQIDGHGGIVSRTGYTGEDGVELIVGSNAASGVWQKLIDAGAVPAGLGCRDTLRLEAAMPLYGHELDENIDPLTAGLDFAVTLEGRDFVGAAALRKIALAGPKLERVGLELDGRRIARQGHTFTLLTGRGEGTITSGTFSPTFQKPIAMGYAPRGEVSLGDEVRVNLGSSEQPARVVPLPFYKRST